MPGACLDKQFDLSRFLLAKRGATLRVTGLHFELTIKQEVLNGAVQTLSRLKNVGAKFSDLGRSKRFRISAQNLRKAKDAVKRRDHFMRQRETEVGAKIGELLLRVLPEYLAFLQPGFDGGEQLRSGERFRKIVIRPEIHSSSHTGGITHASHENERDGGGRRLAPQGFQQRVAVHVVHVHITNDEIR